MDVGLNKPFKEKARDCYEKFMISSPEGAKVKRCDVTVWVDYAWVCVTDLAICNTWKGIGYRAGEEYEFELDDMSSVWPDGLSESGSDDDIWMWELDSVCSVWPDEVSESVLDDGVCVWELD